MQNPEPPNFNNLNNGPYTATNIGVGTPLPQIAIPPAGCGMSLTDQTPEQYMLGLRSVIDIMTRRILMINGDITEYQKWELQGLLIWDLINLRTRFSRYFFSVSRCSSGLKINLFDPFDQLNDTEILIPYKKIDIYSQKFVQFLMKKDDDEELGKLKAMFLHRLQVVPQYYLMYLLGNQTPFANILREFPLVLQSEDPMHLEPTSMLHVSVGSTVLDSVTEKRPIASYMVNQFLEAIRLYTNESDDCISAIRQMINLAWTGSSMKIPEPLDNKTGIDLLKRLKIIQPMDSEESVILPTEFFANMIRLNVELN